MCVENVPQGERTKQQWEAELVKRETWWIRQLHAYQPTGFNGKGFKTTTAKVYNDIHRLPLSRNGNCFSEDNMLMDSPHPWAAAQRSGNPRHQRADSSTSTGNQTQKHRRKSWTSKRQQVRLLRRRIGMEEQDTDHDSDEDLRETGHDQQIEDLICKHKHAQATAPSTYNMRQGITRL